jgi:hypothetical protein
MSRSAKLVFVPAALAVAVPLAGCTRTIDKGKAEKFLKTNINGAQSVSCPDNVTAKKGKSFDCTVTLASGKKEKVTVHMTNDKGGVTVGPGDLRPA